MTWSNDVDGTSLNYQQYHIVEGHVIGNNRSLQIGLIDSGRRGQNSLSLHTAESGRLCVNRI